MARRRIAQHEIAVGEALPWDVYDGFGRLLLRCGHLVVSHNQITGLVERGLYIDAEGGPRHAVTEVVDDREDVPVIDLILDARERLGKLLNADPIDHFPEQLQRVVERIRDAWTREPNAALASIVLDRNGPYSTRHSVDVAVVCRALGEGLGLDAAQLEATMAAALTMNLGMLRYQDELQSCPAPLTEAQRRLIREHPRASVDALCRLGVTNELWINAVLDHHEATDGSGYPRAKRNEEILFAARLVSLADIYCALISGRSYRPPLHPNAVLRRMFLGKGCAVDKHLASRLIRTLGVFPPGTAVRLENGELGVVSRVGKNAATPEVCALIGPRGAPLGAPIPRDTRLPIYSVRESVDWSELGALANMDALWGKKGALASCSRPRVDSETGH